MPARRMSLKQLVSLASARILGEALAQMAFAGRNETRQGASKRHRSCRILIS